ncbi:MAG: GGDEF domain-containing protein [Piscinibacter sp.]|nr:GGDEF domain-containing protein [Piscinibacter sp.]
MPLPRLLRHVLLPLLLAVLVAPALAEPSVRELLERARAATDRDPIEGRRLAEAALQALTAQPDADLEIEARLLLCDHHAERDPEAAQREVKIIGELLPRARRSGLRAGLLGCMGQMREFASDTVRARALYEEAVQLAEQADDADMLANALYQRGYLRGVQGELASGLTDLRRAHQLYSKLEQAPRVANVLNAIAIIYNRMGDHAQARDYFQQSLRQLEIVGALREQAVTLHNLGRALENLGDREAARLQYEAALATSRRIDFPRGEAYALRGIASLANLAGTADQALARLDEADARIGDAPDQRLRAQILLQRGIALRLKKRYAESVQALERALRIFAEADSRNELAATYGALAATHAEAGEWRAAFEREADFKTESDRLLRLQLDQRFATLKIEFDTATKDREYALLQRENRATEQALQHEQRANQLKVIVIGLAAVLLLALALLMLRQWRTSRTMRSLALTDELTGLPNRRAVLTRLQALLDQPGSPPCAVLLADLDHFKRINDEHGHLVGDEVLRSVAARLTESVREPMCVGRLGGEEFLVVLPDTDLEAARQAAERIRESVASLELQRGATPWKLTVSLGVAASGPGVGTVSDMLRRADAALYDAKRAGRNRVIALVA